MGKETTKIKIISDFNFKEVERITNEEIKKLEKEGAVSIKTIFNTVVHDVKFDKGEFHSNVPRFTVYIEAIISI
jgi:hypothetical protein